ncbi:MAG: FAD-dependent oxidoreductase [Bacteroidetes bacterium]|jgi:glycine oxidase|nr:FAD-dependent oxidoreductase [Bacteroidota bacterium]
MNTKRVLIVGDGLAGTLVAWELMDQGIEFNLWGDGSPAASDVAAGMFNPVSFRRILPVWHAQEHLNTARKRYQSCENLLGVQLWHDVALLRIFPDGAYAAQWNERIAEEHPVSSFIERCNDGDWHDSIVAPFGAGRIRDAGWVDVQTLVEKSREFWQKENSWSSRHWNLDDGCPVGFDAVVDCRGVGAKSDLLRYGLEVRPNQGEVLTLEVPSAVGVETVNNVTWAMPIAAGKVRIGSTYRWDLMEAQVLEASQSVLLDKANAARVDTPFTRGQITEHRAGLRPASPDRRPLVGRVSDDIPWYVVCNGWGTRGVLIGPRTAAWTIRTLLDDAWEVPAEVRPDRFRTFTKN